MTSLQKMIRNTVSIKGYMQVLVGRSSPANMNTIRALRRANYRCLLIGTQDDCQIFEIDDDLSLEQYIEGYIEEERLRGNDIDYFTIQDATEAYEGGAR